MDVSSPIALGNVSGLRPVAGPLGQFPGIHQRFLAGQELVDELLDRHLDDERPTRKVLVFVVQPLFQHGVRINAEVRQLAPDFLGPLAAGMEEQREVSVGLFGLAGQCYTFGSSFWHFERRGCRVGCGRDIRLYNHRSQTRENRPKTSAAA